MFHGDSLLISCWVWYGIHSESLGNFLYFSPLCSNALRIARQLNEICLEAQACYSLGNTYTLLRDPAKAIVYHLRHLLIARRLGDRVGEGRAHWSLSNAFAALGRFDWALRCARRHRMIARELHDDTGLMAAQLMIREVQSFMSNHDRDQRDSIATNGWGTESEVSGTRNAIPNGAPPVPCRSTSLTTLATETESSSKGENNECANLEEDNDLDLDADLERELASTAADVLDTVEVVTLGENGKTTAIRLGCLDIPDTVTANPQVTKRDHMASFYSNTPAFRPHPMQPTSRTNSNDIEEQLESIGTANPSNPPSQAYHLPNGSDASVQAAATTEEEQAEDPQECFYSLLLTSQSRRMDEQRCQLRAAPVSLSCNRRSEPVEAAEQSGSTASMHAEAVPDEALFDLIEGVQGDRMNDQRASLPAFPGLRAGRSLQLFDGGSLGNVHGAMLTSTGSGASDGLPEPSSTRSLRTHGLRENSTGNESTNNHGTIRELDDEFLDMILHLQTSTRINDQRSNLPDPLYRDSATQRYSLTIGVTTTDECCSVPDRPASGSFSRPTAATVPDEDFFALIQRVQSTRLDEQRCNPPAPVPRPDVPPNEPEPSPPLSRSDSKSSSGSRRRGTSWRRLAPNQNR
ncbi:unnamed protein product [Dicrocoelium dendriticum]|nr:unnamed protein product [Dicrocoelium dendriticum]